MVNFPTVAALAIANNGRCMLHRLRSDRFRMSNQVWL